MTLGFYFNQKNCVGCRSCQVACKSRNGLEVGQLFRHVTTYEAGEYPDARNMHYAATCNHCENPACVANCPTGAMQKLEDGTVTNDKNVCIGCGTCVSSCPYGVPMVDAEAGKAIKCDTCKALRDAGMNPVCVDTCVMRAIEFGDLDELRAAHPDAVQAQFSFLPDPAETEPCTLVEPYYGIDATTPLTAVEI